MPWLEANLEVDQSEAEATSAALEDAGAVAVTLQNTGDSEVLEPGVGKTPLWPRVRVTGLFAGDTDQQQLLIKFISLDMLERPDRVEFSTLADQQWERSWMDRFQPMCFGQRLWVYPSNIEPPDEDYTILRLDPGLAFGTGTHATTALCLRWLDGADLQGKTVVDYGCGSGILAIAAALLGAGRVIAVDNDPQALLATKDNAARNNVDEVVETIQPEAFSATEVHVLLANILSQPLVDLAPVLESCMAGGGWLVLSGILENQADTVEAAYSDSLQWQEKNIDNGWVRLVGKKNMQEPIMEQHAGKDRDYHAIIADEYEQVVNEPRAYPNELLFRPLDRLIPTAGSAMLDLGCGTGQMLRRYSGRFGKFTGVDHSKEMLEVARGSLEPQQLENTRLMQSDLVEFLSTESGEYDLVTIVGCLHHLHPEQLGTVIQMAAGLLAPGGRMLLAEPLLQANMQPPEPVRLWNQKAAVSLPEYSSAAEEPDEAPIDEQQMLAEIQAARLHIIFESRGWELFPRHLPASLFDRIRLRSLHRRFGASGYVRAFLLERNND